MFTRNVESSTSLFFFAPTLARMSLMFSSTALVWTRMSSFGLPDASTSEPAIVLSALRELVPDTNRKSPARLTCEYLPRGVAFPSTILLFVMNPSASKLDADIIQFRIEIQRMHAALSSYARQSHSAERRSK